MNKFLLAQSESLLLNTSRRLVDIYFYEVGNQYYAVVKGFPNHKLSEILYDNTQYAITQSDEGWTFKHKDGTAQAPVFIATDVNVYIHRYRIFYNTEDIADVKIIAQQANVFTGTSIDFMPNPKIDSFTHYSEIEILDIARLYEDNIEVRQYLNFAPLTFEISKYSSNKRLSSTQLIEPKSRDNSIQLFAKLDRRSLHIEAKTSNSNETAMAHLANIFGVSHLNMQTTCSVEFIGFNGYGDVIQNLTMNLVGDKDAFVAYLPDALPKVDTATIRLNMIIQIPTIGQQFAYYSELVLTDQQLSNLRLLSLNDLSTGKLVTIQLLSSSGGPVQRGTVTVEGKTSTTTDGGAVMLRLLGRQYDLVIEHPDYTTIRDTIDITQGDSFYFPYVMQSNEINVNVAFRDERNEPIEVIGTIATKNHTINFEGESYNGVAFAGDNVIKVRAKENADLYQTFYKIDNFTSGGTYTYTLLDAKFLFTVNVLSSQRLDNVDFDVTIKRQGSDKAEPNVTGRTFKLTKGTYEIEVSSKHPLVAAQRKTVEVNSDSSVTFMFDDFERIQIPVNFVDKATQNPISVNEVTMEYRGIRTQLTENLILVYPDDLNVKFSTIGSKATDVALEPNKTNTIQIESEVFTLTLTRQGTFTEPLTAVLVRKITKNSVQTLWPGATTQLNAVGGIYDLIVTDINNLFRFSREVTLTNNVNIEIDTTNIVGLCNFKIVSDDQIGIDGAKVSIRIDGDEPYVANNVTNSNGNVSFVIPVNSEVQVTVEHSDFESPVTRTIQFIAHNATSTIVMEKRLYTAVLLFSTQNHKPFHGLPVEITGHKYYADAGGILKVKRPKGDYEVIYRNPNKLRLRNVRKIAFKDFVTPNNFITSTSSITNVAGNLVLQLSGPVTIDLQKAANVASTEKFVGAFVFHAPDDFDVNQMNIDLPGVTEKVVAKRLYEEIVGGYNSYVVSIETTEISNITNLVISGPPGEYQIQFIDFFNKSDVNEFDRKIVTFPSSANSIQIVTGFDYVIDQVGLIVP